MIDPSGRGLRLRCIEQSPPPWSPGYLTLENDRRPPHRPERWAPIPFCGFTIVGLVDYIQLSSRYLQSDSPQCVCNGRRFWDRGGQRNSGSIEDRSTDSRQRCSRSAKVCENGPAAIQLDAAAIRSLTG